MTYVELGIRSLPLPVLHRAPPLRSGYWPACPAVCRLPSAVCSLGINRAALFERDGVVVGLIYFVEQSFERGIDFRGK